jgi:hypothetical protein
MMKKSIVTNKLPILILMVFTFLSPLLSIAQAPPGSPNGDGSAPTGESGAVPFDDNMNLIFLVAGLAFAVMVTIKQLRKKAASK